jgi:hypothetical protein
MLTPSRTCLGNGRRRSSWRNGTGRTCGSRRAPSPLPTRSGWPTRAFEGLAAASLRPLVVDVEDEFRLGVRRLASAHLVYRTMQILSHEALKRFARIPALDGSPRPSASPPA